MGMGVLFDQQGNVFTNDPGSVTGPKSILSIQGNVTTNPSTQESVNNQI